MAGCSDETEEEIIGRLLDLSQRMRAHYEETTRAHGLSPAEGQTLYRLDVPAPMSAMAAALHCDASYVTVITDRLEEEGLVERKEDPNDRRVRQLVLTEKGRATRADLVERLHATSPALVPLDPHERLRFLELLRKLEV